MSKTEHATTIHGEVEYEVADCASCEQEFRTDDLLSVRIGEETATQNWHHKFEVHYDSRPTKVWICQSCVETPLPLSIGVFEVMSPEELFKAIVAFVGLLLAAFLFGGAAL